jgi:hypothetical protein
MSSVRHPIHTSQARRRYAAAFKSGEGAICSPRRFLVLLAALSSLVLVLSNYHFIARRSAAAEEGQANTAVNTARHALYPSSSSSSSSSTTSSPPAKHATDDRNVHIIFSTDCGAYQDWQSYLFFYSARRVNQLGHITRISSGCSEEEQIASKAYFDTHISSFAPNHHIHFTPRFDHVDESDPDSGKSYKFFNKPFGTLHWMENAISPVTNK